MGDVLRIRDFNQEEFNNFVLKNKVIGFVDKPVTLKSGRSSNWYVNWRTVTEDVFATDQLSDYLLSFTKSLGLNPDCFYGVPEGASKLGVITQYKWAKQKDNYDSGSHVLAMGRGKAKEHGAEKDRFFLGTPKGKTIVIEDVTTTGSSLLDTLNYLNESCVEVIAAYGLTNRMELTNDGQSVEEAIKKKGVNYYSLSKSTDLFPRAYQLLKPSDDVADAVEREFEKYGIQKIKLR